MRVSPGDLPNRRRRCLHLAEIPAYTLSNGSTLNFYPVDFNGFSLTVGWKKAQLYELALDRKGNADLGPVLSGDCVYLELIGWEFRLLLGTPLYLTFPAAAYSGAYVDGPLGTDFAVSEKYFPTATFEA